MIVGEMFVGEMFVDEMIASRSGYAVVCLCCVWVWDLSQFGTQTLSPESVVIESV